MKKTLVLLGALILALCPSLRAQSVFNCSSFASTGSCGVNQGGQPFWNVNQSSLSGSQVLLLPSGTDHNVGNLVYQTKENVQAFTSTFTFVPDGQNIAFTIQNNNNNPGFDGNVFAGGAGCEGGFFQAFGSTAPPNNTFALMFDSYGGNAANSGTFTYSSAQIYQSTQSPCNPNDSGPNYWGTNKISTSPVPLNSPPSTLNTTTGDTYSATVAYDGSTVTLNLYDVTASGSCPGASCFTQTWSNVFIPSIVAGTTAYIGMSSAAGTIVNPGPLLLKSFSYTVTSPTGTPTPVAYNANATTNNGTQSAASPTYSVAGGTYATSQSVTISDSTSGANICYLLSSGTPTYYPQPNNQGGCNEGTLYSGAINISSSQTLYAMAGTVWGASTRGPPSPLTAATYTIGGTSAASTPTFSPAAGTYTGAQSVTLSTSSAGAAMCYTTDGSSPSTNGSSGCAHGTLYSSAIVVSASETVKAVAGGTGYTDSSVGSATYTIKATTPSFSPGAGTYSGSQSVTISAALGATICYNFTGSPATNGGTGCATGAKYTGPVSVPSSETLYAVAGGTGISDGSVASAAYTINQGAATPTFSPAAGTYSSTQSVALSTTSPGANICWNTTGNPTPNGSNGCTIGTLYSSPISVSSNQTIYASAGGTGYTNSSVGTAAYVITSATANPVFSLASGAYTLPQSTSLSDSTGGSVISYCTTTYLSRCSPGTTYSNPLTISSPETICGSALASGHTPSGIVCNNYTTPSTVTLMIGGKIVYTSPSQ